MARESETTRQHVRTLAWHGMAWAIFAHGCAPTAPGVDADMAALFNHVRSQAPFAPTVVTHDLGPVLASGQELWHAFRIENSSARPWRITGAQALTPCCSAVGSLPETLPCGRAIEVPVVFRPGHQSGRKRVEFLVRTDDPEAPVHRFALIASLISEIEVSPQGANPTSLPLNTSVSHRFAIICRRISPERREGSIRSSPIVTEGRDGGDNTSPEEAPTTEGRTAPISLTASPSLSASFLGPPVERRLDDGTIESTRDFEVTLPPSTEIGAHRGTVVLAWPDGREWPQDIFWQVAPRLRASPSGLVLKPRDSEEPERVAITVHADDRPFRVTEVTGPILAEPPDGLPTEPGRAHTLLLTLDPVALSADGTSDIHIATDHPDQREVIVSVLVWRVSEGAVR